MRIGIIGAGNIGTALAKWLGAAGHEVMLSYARDVAKLEEAARAFGAAGPLSGKIVWDCTNVLKPDLSGLEIGTATSGGETIAALIPEAKVVKGIPPFAELMHGENPLISGTPADVFMCGDDAQAKAVVARLIEALPARSVDAGPLENARYVEPAGFLLVRLAYGLGMGSRIGLALIKD
jgi:8-hydroxy-5-deazaflavin:NADPH oxidoreductase